MHRWDLCIPTCHVRLPGKRPLTSSAVSRVSECVNILEFIKWALSSPWQHYIVEKQWQVKPRVFTHTLQSSEVVVMGNRREETKPNRQHLRLFHRLKQQSTLSFHVFLFLMLQENVAHMGPLFCGGVLIVQTVYSFIVHMGVEHGEQCGNWHWQAFGRHFVIKLFKGMNNIIVNDAKAAKQGANYWWAAGRSFLSRALTLILRSPIHTPMSQPSRAISVSCSRTLLLEWGSQESNQTLQLLDDSLY